MDLDLILDRTWLDQRIINTNFLSDKFGLNLDYCFLDPIRLIQTQIYPPPIWLHPTHYIYQLVFNVNNLE